MLFFSHENHFAVCSISIAAQARETIQVRNRCESRSEQEVGFAADLNESRVLWPSWPKIVQGEG